jgi:hypothetical protein
MAFALVFLSNLAGSLAFGQAQIIPPSESLELQVLPTHDIPTYTLIFINSPIYISTRSKSHSSIVEQLLCARNSIFEQELFDNVIFIDLDLIGCSFKPSSLQPGATDC